MRTRMKFVQSELEGLDISFSFFSTANVSDSAFPFPAEITIYFFEYFCAGDSKCFYTSFYSAHYDCELILELVTFVCLAKINYCLRVSTRLIRNVQRVKENKSANQIMVFDLQERT